MESDDPLAVLSALSPINERENDIVDDSACDTSMEDPQRVEVEEVKANTDIPQSSAGTTSGDNLLSPSIDSGVCTVNSSTALRVGFQLDESAVVMKEADFFSHTIHTANGCATVQDVSGSDYKKEDEVLESCQQTRVSTLSGSKRPRETNVEEEASVQVIYKSLTGDSRKKLEELLQQWSQWHAKHCLSGNDSEEVLESGEEIYFPALKVGVDKASIVSFWLDTEMSKNGKKDLISFDGNSVPVYDRGFSLALTSMDDSKNPEGVMEISESRCFNCGSFNHSLKDCTQPRDNVAVNNARKQHKSKRNQTPGSRNSSRYYQESVGGKYDGLKPGSLDAETRKVLGLGMFDPPPWLNRMREIGYPPGYMDEDEDLPSGITIFDDEEKEKEKDRDKEKKEEKEEGEISHIIRPELPKKKSVEFPGVNAPIPEWADENQWGAASGNSDVMFRDHQRSFGSNSNSSSSSRYNNRSSDTTIARSYHHEQRWPRDSGDNETRGGGHHQEQRWSRDFGDDDEPPPPGCVSPMSSHSRRYGGGGYDSGYNSNNLREPWSSSFERSLSDRSRDFGYNSNNLREPWSSSFERSLSDRSRRSPLAHDGSSPSYRSYGSHLSSSSPR